MLKDERRSKFLLEMHKAYWNNISRAEDASWKMIAAYTALIAGLAFSSPVIGYTGILAIFIPFSFMSVAISLNANLWFLRNIGLISNLEREFLNDTDYDRLIPKRWQLKYPFINTEPWCLFALVYFSVCCIVTALLLPQINKIAQIYITCLFLGCLIPTVWYWNKLRKRYERFKIEAPGGSPKRRNPQTIMSQ